MSEPPAFSVMNCVPFHSMAEVGRQHARQQVGLELRARIFADQVDRRVGDADRAHDAELALHEQVLAGVLGDRRAWARRARARRRGGSWRGTGSRRRRSPPSRGRRGGTRSSPRRARSGRAACSTGPFLSAMRASSSRRPPASTPRRAKCGARCACMSAGRYSASSSLQAAVERVEVLPRAVRRNRRRCSGSGAAAARGSAGLACTFMGRVLGWLGSRASILDPIHSRHFPSAIWSGL